MKMETKMQLIMNAEEDSNDREGVFIDVVARSRKKEL